MGDGLLSDRPFDERPFRIPTILDCFARGALSTAPKASRRACQVVDEMDRLCWLRGKPKSIRVGNRPELAGHLLNPWAYLNRDELDFSRLGKPSKDAYIEAFNRRLRQECLNAFWFFSSRGARARIEEWRNNHIQSRPRSALGGLFPTKFDDPLQPALKVAG